MVWLSTLEFLPNHQFNFIFARRQSWLWCDGLTHAVKNAISIPSSGKNQSSRVLNFSSFLTRVSRSSIKVKQLWWSIRQENEFQCSQYTRSSFSQIRFVKKSVRFLRNTCKCKTEIFNSVALKVSLKAGCWFQQLRNCLSHNKLTYRIHQTYPWYIIFIRFGKNLCHLEMQEYS